MKKLPLFASILLIAASAVKADTILGVYAGAGIWNATPNGQAGEPSISVKALGAKEQTNNYYYIALEHPIPVIPNIRLEHTSIQSNQAATISKAFAIDGTTFNPGTITSSIDLSHTDAILYYEILDNWINLDLGVTARKFNGYVSANCPQGCTSGSAVSKKVNIDQTLPLIYGKLQFDLPFSGLSVGIQGNYISYQNDKLTDYRANLSYLYDSFVDLGVEVGYRKMSLTIDDSDIKGDLTFKGPYASVIAHF